MDEHTPGCRYQARCLNCDWKSSAYGDRENAFHQAWDHTVEGERGGKGHKVEYVETSHWDTKEKR